MPPTPPPPRVGGGPSAAGGRKSTSGRWQDGYQYGQGDTQGREATCRYVGALWVGALEVVVQQLKDVGVEPMFKPAELTGAIVLTVDKMLPPEVELTPEIVAAVGTSTILVQRLVHAKAIKAHQDKQKARASGVRPVVDVMATEAPGPATPPEARPEPPPISTEPAVVPPAPAPEVAITVAAGSNGVHAPLPARPSRWQAEDVL